MIRILFSLFILIGWAHAQMKCTAPHESTKYVEKYSTMPSMLFGGKGTFTVIIGNNENMDGGSPFLWNGTIDKDGLYLFESPYNDTVIWFNGHFILGEGIPHTLKYKLFDEITTYKCKEIE